MITGPGQPVGAVEHGGVDRAARGVGERLPRATCATRSSTSSSPPRWPRPAGCSTSTTAATSRCSRGPTPGTWAPTCPASRGCSCPTSAASTATARPATRWPSQELPRLRLRRARRRRCHDGVDPSGAARRADRARRRWPSSGCRRSSRCRSRTPGPSRRRWPRSARPGPRSARSSTARCPARRATCAYRLYRPATPGPHPVVVYFHGGGWVLGSADSDDPLCRDLCVRSGADHHLGRLPPRAGGPLPGGRRRRVRRASQWVAANADRARRHPRPAGGVRLERRGEHRRGRVPAGPRCRRPGDRRSGAAHAGHRQRPEPHVVHRATPTGYMLTTALMTWFWDHYADEADRTDPRAAPLRAKDLSNLPPALILTCEFDPLRDEGAEYAKALEAAGNDVRHLAVSRPHPHLAHDGRRGPVGRLRPGGDGCGPARVLRRDRARLTAGTATVTSRSCRRRPW